MGGPDVVHDPAEFQRRCEDARAAGHHLGLVPTMGALHEGHLALMRAARDEGASYVVVTIFVNPLQFGPSEDLARYPRTLDADLAHCASVGVDLVFAPSVEAMYGDEFTTEVRVRELTRRLEGVHRPDHFDGVTTVVAKLFLLAGRCTAIFGRKDYQQWRVIERMATNLMMPVRVVSHATVREHDGLALSSRNRYLSPPDRERALAIARGLRAAHDAWIAGEGSPGALLELARAPISASVDAIDYVDLVDPRTLEPLASPPERERGALVVVAVRVGTTRLIDNLCLGVDPRP